MKNRSYPVLQSLPLVKVLGSFFVEKQEVRTYSHPPGAKFDVIEFDVTSDVAAFLNGTYTDYGWLLKKTNEGQNGQVSFGTKESASAPQLVITYKP